MCFVGTAQAEQTQASVFIISCFMPQDLRNAHNIMEVTFTLKDTRLQHDTRKICVLIP